MGDKHRKGDGKYRQNRFPIFCRTEKQASSAGVLSVDFDNVPRGDSIR